jgi:hypothetical protein
MWLPRHGVIPTLSAYINPPLLIDYHFVVMTSSEAFNLAKYKASTVGSQSHRGYLILGIVTENIFSSSQRFEVRVLILNLTVYVISVSLFLYYTSFMFQSYRIQSYRILQ